jgi:eukaryotic-like serine/threonine-protein kinase
MPDERARKIEAIFHEAAGLASRQRDAFLEEACAGDGALKAEVESLLDAIDGEPDFLDKPAWSAFVTTDSAVASGAEIEPEQDIPFERLGEFRLIRRLGEGGMGVVYLALQESLGRQAAVKVIRPERMGGFEIEMRFRREVEAISELRDPHIVTVYGSGEEQGVRWFAMEYVPGKGLDSVLREAATEGKRIPIPELIGWTRDIAHSLGCAHEAGIIHRDVKPSNIMITPEGRPMLFDFGVARHANLSTLTLTGEFRGTPHYASPEQVRAKRVKIDHRTDIYSLGSTLYEAVTGRVPFEGETTEQVFHQILEADPEPPCRLNGSISRDLGTVIEKAMEKDPARRYQTAGEFADDLDRILDGEMIAARPAGFSTRVLKRVRRHPVLSTATAGALLSMTLLVLYVLWSYPQIVEERNRAEEERKAALAAKAEAERETEKAEAINDFLITMLSSPDPDQEGRDVKVVDVLEKAADTIAESFGGHREIEAACRNTIGHTYQALGLLDAAEPQHKAALDIYLDILGEEKDEALAVMNDLGNVYRKQGRIAEAESLYRKILAANRATLGDHHIDTLAIMNNLGLVLQVRGDFAGAEETHRKVAAAREGLLGREHLDTLKSKNNLANSLWRLRRLPEAEELHREILEAKRRVLGVEHSSTIASLFNLAVIIKDQGKLDEAEKLQREVLEIQLRLLGEEHPDTLASVYNLAITLFRLGRLPEAETLHRKAFEGRRNVLGETHPATRASLSYVAILIMQQGRLAEAEEIQRRLLAICTEAVGEGDDETLQVMNNLACILWELGRVAETELIFRKLVQLSSEAGPRYRRKTASYRVSLGECLSLLERHGEAETELLAALKDLTEAGFGEGEDANNARKLLVDVYRTLGNTGKAEKYGVPIDAQDK